MLWMHFRILLEYLLHWQYRKVTHVNDSYKEVIQLYVIHMLLYWTVVLLRDYIRSAALTTTIFSRWFLILSDFDSIISGFLVQFDIWMDCAQIRHHGIYRRTQPAFVLDILFLLVIGDAYDRTVYLLHLLHCILTGTTFIIFTFLLHSDSDRLASFVISYKECGRSTHSTKTFKQKTFCIFVNNNKKNKVLALIKNTVPRTCLHLFKLKNVENV